jgi:hypothetical protein
MQPDLLSPTSGSRTPRNNDKQEDPRKTTITNWSFHDRIDKYSSQYSATGGFPSSSFYGEEYKNKSSMNGSKMDSNYELSKPEIPMEKKYSGSSKYSANIPSTKENYPPVGDEFYSNLTMSLHTKKSPILSNLTSSKYEAHKIESPVSTSIKPFDSRGSTFDIKKFESPTASPRMETSSSKK